VLSNFPVLVYFVLEEGGLKLLLFPIVIFVDPVVCDGTDENWHDHWILLHDVQVILFEEVESVVV